METKDLLSQIEEILAGRDRKVLIEFLHTQHPVDIANAINELPKESAALVYRSLSKDDAAETFAYLDIEKQAALLDSFTDHEVSEMMEELFVDDAVDMVEELPANVVSRILRLSTAETRDTINHFLKYPEDSAGSVMTSEYTKLEEDMTVAEAIAYIRQHGDDKETIYTAYITTKDRKLIGAISIRSLLLAKDEQIVGDIMNEVLIKASTTDDQEEVLRLFTNYDLLSLPIVDAENRLVGIVTVDDALDVAHEEATEDFEKMAAIHPSEKPYLKSGVFEQSKNRITWLLILMFSGIINGSILQSYEHAFLAVPLLVSFIPMLTDTGGNAGSQSSTMIIRGMALGELSFRDFWSIIWKELRISLLVGSVLAIANFLRIFFTYDHNIIVSATVSITLLFTVLMAKILGSALPMLARKVKLDPAIMAAPLITTIVDAGALIIFFNVAELLMGL